VNGHIGANPFEVAVESVPAGDLERGEPDLPQEPRRREFFLETADVQHPDGVRAVSHRPIERNAVDEAAVEEVRGYES